MKESPIFIKSYEMTVRLMAVSPAPRHRINRAWPAPLGLRSTPGDVPGALDAIFD